LRHPSADMGRHGRPGLRHTTTDAHIDFTVAVLLACADCSYPGSIVALIYVFRLFCAVYLAEQALLS
jgi:hypothetical protein